jgi:organizing structure protein 2
VHSQVARVEDGFNSTLDRAFALEHSFTSTVASLHPARSTGETVLPGAIYVLVAAMGASVLTRGSFVLVRAALPLAVGVGAAQYILPVTSHNVGQLVWKWEKRFPAIANAHENTQKRVTQFVKTGIDHSKMSGEMLTNKIGAARESMEDWVKKGK